jgi:bifunctional non-homologous end joining protein LigD
VALAFDVLFLGGRRVSSAKGEVLARASPGLQFNKHLDEEDGPLVFRHACKLGLEGIESKRRDSRY